MAKAYCILPARHRNLCHRLEKIHRPLFGPAPQDRCSLRMTESSNEEETLVSSIAKSATVWTLENEPVSLLEVLHKSSPNAVILSCLSHFGDFNAWELTQQYRTAMKEGGKLSNIESLRVVLVGIGSVSSAQAFASDLDLDTFLEEESDQRLTLVADPNGTVAESLGCYRGWLTVDRAHRKRYPQTDIPPLLKLLGMIFSFGSPGTIQKVLYGYIGDTTGSKGVDGRTWVVESLLQGSAKGRFPTLTTKAFQDTPITSSLRPFELATLRLQTGLHIVQNWGRLGPEEGDLVTHMGGTFVLDSSLKCKWNHFDQGILTYVDIDEAYEVVGAVSKGQSYRPWSDEQKAALKKEREALLVQQGRFTVSNDPLARELNDPPLLGVQTPKEEPETPTEKLLRDTDISESSRLENKQVENASSIGELVVNGNNVDEALLGEKVEEAIEDKVGVLIDGLEDASNEVDSFVTEKDAGTSDGSINSQCAPSEKERFQRALLQTQIQYSVRSDGGRLETPSNIRVTSGDKDERELFQRSLLDARYQYETAITSTDSSESKSQSFAEELSFVNGAALSQDEESKATDKKELFQRALLRARMRNKKP